MTRAWVCATSLQAVAAVPSSNCLDIATDFATGSGSGGTFESFSDNRDWWVHEHLQSFIDEGRLAVVFHYGESDCDGVEAWERYGAGISFLCEDPAAGGYRR